MLILNRSVGETIRIGENIVIKMVNSYNGETWIGIEAPPDIKILRSELNRKQIKNAK